MNSTISINGKRGMHVKRLCKVMVMVAVLLILLTGCNQYDESFFSVRRKDVRFMDLKIGTVFWGGRDGYYEKLPQNYCIRVDLGEKACLFRFSDETVPLESFNSLPYDTAILEAHFIKGHYNDEYLLLCEEKEDDSLVYWSFRFSDETIESYTDIEQVYQRFPPSSIHWSSLCNTNAQTISK